MKIAPSERRKSQLSLYCFVLVLVAVLMSSSTLGSLQSGCEDTLSPSSPIYSDSVNQYSSSPTVGNVTNLSSELSSDLVWAAGDGVIDNQLIVTGGNGLVNISLSDPTSLTLLSGIYGYTQFTQPTGSSLIIGGNNPGAQLYAYYPGASMVLSLDSEFPADWTGSGSDLLMSLSQGGNYTFIVEEHNGTSTGTSPPQIGLLFNGLFQNITSVFPQIPAVGAGYFSAYGDGDFLLLTTGYGYLYNVTTGSVSNVSSVLHGNFGTPLGLWLPSPIICYNGQFLVAYINSLIAFNPLTDVTQTVFTTNPGSFFSFVTSLGNQVYVGEESGPFTELFESTNGSGFVLLTSLWGGITDIASFDNALWAVGHWTNAVLYAISPPPVLEAINVTPSSATVLLDHTINFSAIPYFPGLYSSNKSLFVSYSWSILSDLGSLNRTTGASVAFKAGNSVGTINLQVNATFEGNSVESAPIPIQIQRSILESVTATPSSTNMAAESSITLTAIPIFGGENSTGATTFAWSLSNGLGHLNASTGRTVQLYSGMVGGVDTALVNATYNGETVQGGPLAITIFGTGLADPNAIGIEYQQYTNIAPKSSSSFNLVTQNGNIGISFGIMGGTAEFNLTQGPTLVCSFNMTGGPIDYNVMLGSDNFAYVNFAGNGANLELSVSSKSSETIVVAYNEYNGFISNWTASMITYPPQWGLTFFSADGPPNNTGMSFTVIAPTDNSVWMASSIDEGYGSVWSAQVGFNRDVGNETVSYAGWGGGPPGDSYGGQDLNLPLTPGVAYNFTMELLYGTTWGFFCNGIPINDTGLGYKVNMTTSIAYDGDVGIETSSVHSPSVNLTSNVVIPIASEFRYNGKWYPSDSEYLIDGVIGDWYNGNISSVPSMSLWNVAGHLENSSIPNGTIVVGQSQPPIYAPSDLNHQEPIFGNFTLSPKDQGNGVFNGSWNGSNVTLVPENPVDIVSVYSLNGNDEVTEIYNTILTKSLNIYQSSSTKITVAVGTNPSGTVTRETVLQRTQTSELYKITFTETGLGPGSVWYVDLNGTTENSTSDQITFLEPNGTYVFNVPPPPEVVVSPLSGNVTVMGANVNETVHFTPAMLRVYSVTFTESGLPSSSRWAVTLNGGTLTFTSSSLVFSEPNGTYSFMVGSISGYTVSPSSGYLTVNGSNVTEIITFTQLPAIQYNITFSETGLTSGTSWTVTLNGTTESSTGDISFSVPNGTYSFSIASTTGYNETPSFGSMTVNGHDLSQMITFTQVIKKGYFTGTISPTNASIYVNGTLYQAVNGQFNISLFPGTYEIKISAPGYSTYNTNITISSSYLSKLPIQSLAKISKPTSFPFLLVVLVVVIIIVATVAAVVLATARSRRKKS